MEVWDIYNENREKTGKTHIRGVDMQEGDFHQVVHIWIMNEEGQFLIQQRQSWKKGWANMWDCAAAGAALSKETSELAAIRETKEELGLDLQMENAEILFTVKFSRGFDDHWLVKQNLDINNLSLQYEEVADAKWATMDEIKELVSSGEFIRYHILEQLFELIESKISLKKATLQDTESLFELQKKVFTPLYEKYEDHETSPVFQSLERFKERLITGDFYKIMYTNSLVGSLHVYAKSPGVMRLHMINILVDYQGKGIAQHVMSRLESMYPEAVKWELDTILEEERNCYLYEKMGYVQTEDRWKINDKMTLVHYVKTANLNRMKAL
ncbi:GNAT family N-acetyltransferase [Psychrobacillus glaciei]|uniref:GNAT family N-acetyltransferase n=1 Tax=Psychrobacillus glaciei TaxID=2283160 RepID=A0A5J6SRH0_9BACI|nr:GNAT family N-acetyltransferase [Psychrobacillus glaciei]QFG00230.1 GNAT family N-acetyltransferase [Psychrobacillus glaciei]